MKFNDYLMIWILIVNEILVVIYSYNVLCNYVWVIDFFELSVNLNEIVFFHIA